MKLRILLRTVVIFVMLGFTDTFVFGDEYYERNGYEYTIKQKPGVMVEYEAIQTGRLSLNEDIWRVGGEWFYNGLSCEETTLDIDESRKNPPKSYQCKYLYADKKFFTTLKKFDVEGVEKVYLGYDDPIKNMERNLIVCEGALENSSSNLNYLLINYTVSSIESRAFYGMTSGIIHCTAPIPPKLASDAFNSEAYRNVTLIVPDAKMDAYRNSWWRFENIISEIAYETPMFVERDRRVQLLVGERIKLTLETAIPNEYLEWKSYNESVATVENGVVTANKAGRTVIGVTNLLNGEEALAIIEVMMRHSSLEIDYSGIYDDGTGSTDINLKDFILEDGGFRLVVGDEYTIRLVESSPSNLYIDKVTWISNNPNIVEVDEHGRVMAKSQGSAVISLSTDYGLSNTVPILVTDYFYNNGIKYRIEDRIKKYVQVISDENYKNSKEKEVVLKENPNSLSQTFILKSLSSSCFKGCKFESIKIPNTVTDIESSAFESCTLLISVELPDSLSSIGTYCFGNCVRLSAITLPESLTSIGEGAFKNCIKLSSCVLPPTVTIIPGVLFSDCENLSSFEINPTVTYIGGNAFSGCSSLTSIVIPSSVCWIGSNAFGDCVKLNEVKFCDGESLLETNSDFNANYSHLYSPFAHTNIKRLYLGRNISNVSSTPRSPFYGLPIEDVTIGPMVTSLFDELFMGCQALTSIEIPNSVIEMGRSIFDGCKMLQSIKLSNNIKTIGYGTFYRCENLKNIEIPDSVELIDRWAFSECGSLESVSMGSSVKVIEECAFRYCSNLRNLTLSSSLETIEEGAFMGCNKLGSVLVPPSVISCKSKIGARKIAYPDHLAGLGSDYISYVIKYPVKDVIIEKGIVYSKDFSTILYAPFSISGEFVIPESVVAIGKYAFLGCEKLLSIKIPDTLTTIEEYGFSECGFTNIAIPNTVTTIGRGAFSKSSLDHLRLSDNISKIEDYFFVIVKISKQ